MGNGELQEAGADAAVEIVLKTKYIENRKSRKSGGCLQRDIRNGSFILSESLFIRFAVEFICPGLLKNGQRDIMEIDRSGQWEV